MNANDLLTREEEAYHLMEAAVLLDQARQNEAGDEKAVLAAALNNNLELWIAIRAAISMPVCRFSVDVKENLIRLSKYVVATTRTQGGAITGHVLSTLININLQISEGLLEDGEKTDYYRSH